MVDRTITKAGLFSPGRPVFGVLVLGFLCSPPICELSADDRQVSTTARAEACREHQTRLRTGTGTEAEYALKALANCPTSPHIRRLLQKTIENGDFRQRRGALHVLGRHLDADIVEFLIESFYKPALSPAEKVLIYEYLGRLSEPRWKSPLRRIFREGLFSREPRVRLSAVRGLGRCAATEDWDDYLAPLAPGADRDMLRALLIAARHLRATGALDLGERHLRDPRPDIALAAIELLGVLPGARAREALVLLDYQNQPDGAPLTRRVGSILQGHDTSGQFTPSGEAAPTGVTLGSARLYLEPHDRAPILGAVAADTIVYLLEQDRSRDYIARSDGRPGFWVRVATARGLVGWMHSGDVFASPCPPGRNRYCAEN